MPDYLRTSEIAKAVGVHSNTKHLCEKRQLPTLRLYTHTRRRFQSAAGRAEHLSGTWLTQLAEFLQGLECVIDPVRVQPIEIGALIAHPNQVAGGGEVFQVSRDSRLAELELHLYVWSAHLTLPGQ